MKIRTVLVLSAIGGFAYLHVRNGGRFTIDSIADTLGTLFGRAKREASRLKDEAERAAVHDVASNVAKATEPPLH
jgi:hypothetical protein